MIRSQRQSTSRPRGLHTELDFSFNVWGVSFFLESDNPLNLEPFVVTVQLNQNLKLSDTVPCVWLSFEIAKNTNQTTIPRRPCEYYPTVTCHCKSLWEEQSWAGTAKMTWAKTITENLCMHIINYTLAFGGPWMQGHILRISVLSAAYDGAACYVRCHLSGMCCPGRKILRLHSSKTRCSYLSAWW